MNRVDFIVHVEGCFRRLSPDNTSREWTGEATELMLTYKDFTMVVVSYYEHDTVTINLFERGCTISNSNEINHAQASHEFGRVMQMMFGPRY